MQIRMQKNVEGLYLDIHEIQRHALRTLQLLLTRSGPNAQADMLRESPLRRSAAQ